MGQGNLFAETFDERDSFLTMSKLLFRFRPSLRMIPVSCWCLILLLLVSRAIASEAPKQFYPKSPKESDRFNGEKANEPHSRQKRLIWVTDDGRLALPPGTSLIIAPTLAMPFVRYPPDGFHSNISISIPLTSECCCECCERFSTLNFQSISTSSD